MRNETKMKKGPPVLDGPFNTARLLKRPNSMVLASP